jgi:hypothetical protein
VSSEPTRYYHNDCWEEAQDQRDDWAAILGNRSKGMFESYDDEVYYGDARSV